MKNLGYLSLLGATAVIPFAVYAAWYATIVIQTTEIAPDGSYAPNFSHYFCIYEALDPKASGGWSLFLLSDPPEGTGSVFTFPSWLISVCGVLFTVAWFIVSAKIIKQKK